MIFDPPTRRLRDLPPPDPEVEALHARQHRIINDFQRIQNDAWSLRHREAWHLRQEPGP